MKLLVTGALGHIGSRFIRHLNPGDWESVVLLDDLSTQRYGPLFNLPEDVPFRFVEGDICAVDLERYFEGVDLVIHLAAITNAPATFGRAEEVERVNCEGTRKVAEACRSSGCKLVFISTTSVYGSQNQSVDEDCSELKAQSPYAESKLQAERIIQSLGEKGRLQFVICRFGTILGPSVGRRFHTEVNKFVWQACLGRLPVGRPSMLN
jgi:UDP-glucose 4-epimerase